jgi:hypothetical protein
VQSDEQLWWERLLDGARDPALEVPHQVWDSALATAVDPQSAPPEIDILPDDQSEWTINETDLDASGHDDTTDPGDPAGPIYHDDDASGLDAGAHDHIGLPAWSDEDHWAHAADLDHLPADDAGGVDPGPSEFDSIDSPEWFG